MIRRSGLLQIRVNQAAARDATAAQAQASLGSSLYADLHNVACSDAGGALRLSGQVESYYLKQVAQEIVRKVDGVDAIVNELEVVEPAGKSRLVSRHV